VFRVTLIEDVILVFGAILFNNERNAGIQPQIMKTPDSMINRINPVDPPPNRANVNVWSSNMIKQAQLTQLSYEKGINVVHTNYCTDGSATSE
jgi:hypothetical protein